jgi:hypothetical protein
LHHRVIYVFENFVVAGKFACTLTTEQFNSITTTFETVFFTCRTLEHSEMAPLRVFLLLAMFVCAYVKAEGDLADNADDNDAAAEGADEDLDDDLAQAETEVKTDCGGAEELVDEPVDEVVNEAQLIDDDGDD